MKFCDTQHFPQVHIKLLNTMFGLSSEQIRYMVPQFDKQYFSTVKLNIDELLKDLCDLTPLSCCFMWISWRSLKWVHAAWSVHHWICWQNCWHVWVQGQRCNICFRRDILTPPWAKRKENKKRRERKTWNITTGLSPHGPEPGFQYLVSDLPPSRRTARTWPVILKLLLLS